MTKIGYVRVSTGEQTVDRQLDALRDECDEVHVEILSAASPKRPVYDKVLRELREGDTLIVLDLDRAYRSADDGLREIKSLTRRGIGFRMLNFPLDTTTAEGMFVVTMLSGICEFERNILSRRTKEGLAAARARGKRLGRPRKLRNEQVELTRCRLEAGEIGMRVAARELGVAPWTLARALKRKIE